MDGVFVVVLHDLNLVLKADVSGSLEAFEDEIAKLPQQDVQVSVIRSGVGGVTESDVTLAAASDAVVLGFNVRPVGDAAQVADREGVEIRTYSIIYRAFEDLRDAMQGMLAPEEIEETVGEVEVSLTTTQAENAALIAAVAVRRGLPARAVSIALATAAAGPCWGSPRPTWPSPPGSPSPPTASTPGTSPTTPTAASPARCSPRARATRSS